MPAEALTTTTLSQALDAHRHDFWVASTSDMDVGDFIVCRGEVMKVNEVLDSTHVTVTRGYAGTKARSHANSQRIFVGSPEKFQSIRDSATGLFGDSGTYPEFMLPGQRAKDDAGNEYVLLDPLNISMHSGTSVVISQDGLYTCTVASGGKQGSVAVLVEACTSGQYTWGQIYGRCDYAQEASATSGITSAFIPLAQTSVTTPVVGMAATSGTWAGQYVIHGMFIVGAASTATTSASSATGVSVPVWLNYPFLMNYGTITRSSAAP